MAKWATKNTPNVKGRYLVAYQSVVRQDDRYEYPKDNWMWKILPDCGTANDSEVLSGRHKPAPYKG